MAVKYKGKFLGVVSTHSDISSSKCSKKTKKNIQKQKYYELYNSQWL